MCVSMQYCPGDWFITEKSIYFYIRNKWIQFFRYSTHLLQGTTSGPAKVHRAIEHLRTNVVKGLGVKLLDRVLDIMEEDDEDKREVRIQNDIHDTECFQLDMAVISVLLFLHTQRCLREQMGEDKYQSYALMVRQLKFFEDVSFKG